jgi:hypothetical protein
MLLVHNVGGGGGETVNMGYSSDLKEKIWTTFPWYTMSHNIFLFLCYWYFAMFYFTIFTTHTAEF